MLGKGPQREGYEIAVGQMRFWLVMNKICFDLQYKYPTWNGQGRRSDGRARGSKGSARAL